MGQNLEYELRIFSRISNDNCLMYENNIHYENRPMQYLAIFYGCKNDNFQMKNYDIFLIFAQNIDCGYTLEPPQ